MVNLFDYIFYRAYRFYNKRDGTPAIYASGILSVMQFFSLLSALAIFRLIVNFPIPQKYFIIPIVMILIGINWYRYERNFDIKKLDEKWSKEGVTQKRWKGWLIVASTIFFILFPITIGILKNNLGLI